MSAGPRRAHAAGLVCATLAAAFVAGACARQGSVKPITGVLNHASGTGASLATNAGSGSGFQLDAVLDGATVSGGSNVAWQCFAPDPPQYPNYDIQSSDGATYLFAIVVTTSMWHAGSMPIDNVNVIVQLSMPDRFGVSTNGVLTLDSAGTANATTSGSGCAFHIDGAKLYGLKETPAKSGR